MKAPSIVIFTVRDLTKMVNSLSDYMYALPKTVIPAWIAGIQAPWIGSKFTIPGTGCPLPCGHDGLSSHLTELNKNPDYFLTQCLSLR
jgi:hypothetical protein